MVVALKLSAPILVPALVIGFVISLFQSMTQIQEVTLAFVPKVIGVGLSLLLVGRILYRMEQLYVGGGGAPGSDPSFARSPLTLVVFGLVAGYYTAYAAGLLRWRRRAEPLAA